MISESFLRNYSINKILIKAAIEKEKLKVYYAKNIGLIFKENRNQNQNRKQNQNSNKNNDNHQQPQVFYRYTVNNIKSQIFKERNNFDSEFQYRGKPKVPLRYKEMRFQKPNQSPDNQTEYQQKYLKSVLSLQQFKKNRIQSISSSKQTNKRTERQFRKTVGSQKSNNYFQISLIEQKTDIMDLNKIQCTPKVLTQKICLQNKKILKCTANPNKKIDNFLLYRQESLKKSLQRGQRFKKIIKRKYAHLGTSKTHCTEIQDTFRELE